MFFYIVLAMCFALIVTMMPPTQPQPTAGHAGDDPGPSPPPTPLSILHITPYSLPVQCSDLRHGNLTSNNLTLEFSDFRKK